MHKISYLLVILLLVACGDDKKKERPVSPRVKKETKIASPKTGSRYAKGEVIAIEVASEKKIDSVKVEVNGKILSFTSSTFDVILDDQKFGSKRIKTQAFFEGKSESHYIRVVILPNEAPQEMTYEIVASYAHDINDYTQGLLIDDGYLFESSGQNGKSTLEKKEIKTGKTINQHNLSDEYFGEGLALIDEKFYQLTYTSGRCYVYDRNFEEVNSFSYQGEGWGLTSYQGNLLMSNGSEKIYTRDPLTFSIVDELEVYDNKGKIDDLNELEIIDDLIYSNVYQEDYVVVIDPSTGAVLQKIDFSGLLNKTESRNVDVLNGVAFDKATRKVYVTGKLWPKLFEVRIKPKQPI